MSSNHSETHVDLIDFHVGSPVLPRRSSVSEIQFGYETENLIDTELPVFEKKLQTQSSTINSQSRRTSIDVEDILINIDSDEFERDSLDGEEVETGDFLNVCEGATVDNGNAEATLPVDNFEALLVLKNLDDLLNATLEESEDITNGNTKDTGSNQGSEELDDDTQYIIEECLGDLDNYLQAIDTYDTESNLSDGSNDQSSPSDYSNLQDEEPQAEFNEELARSKLRQIEENYRKFVASGIVNRGYIDTEHNGNFTLDDHLRRPSSVCAMASHLLSRKQALKANTVNGARRERPRLIRRKSLNENYIAPLSSTLTRTSGTDAVATAPENGRLSHDVSRERHAHASADCCTGTVFVEPLHRQSKADSSSTSAILDETVPSEACGNSRSPWLRSSMRRLQQLTLPNVDRPDIAVNVDNGGDSVVRLEVPDDARPVSAPSRLPSLTTPSDRSSRSRSRDLVTPQSNGRARSSSASSHSRRRRSVSSSGTSVASSVDSTLSRMPPLEGTTNTNNVEEPAVNNNQRRYVFLISGIVYGAGKLQAFRALEHSRAGEKAKRKAEREARLIEETRLASERDIQQMLEAFSPPKASIPRVVDDVGFNHPPIETDQALIETDEAPVETVQKPEETSSKSTLSAEGFASPSDSNYNTPYSNDGDGSESQSEYTTPFSKSSDVKDDLFDKPLDLSGDDIVTNDESGCINEDFKDI